MHAVPCFVELKMAAEDNQSKRAGIPGEMVRISVTNSNILAFISHNAQHRVCSNALVLIPGLTDGMMSMAYTHALNENLLAVDYSLVQVNLSTSFYQFGLHTLDTDVAELTEVVDYLVNELHFSKIVLLGHSTGCQDALYFLRHSKSCDRISAVILQGAVSDRDGLEPYDNNSPALLAEARRLVQEGHQLSLLSGFHCGAPITAQRYLSLGGRLTPDDMFSVDLTSTELEPILAPVKVPILLCYSEQDEYVPDMTAQKESSQRMVDTMMKLGNTGVVERVYIDGDHGLSEEKYYLPFVEIVMKFLKSHCN